MDRDDDAALAADLARLRARPYAEVGVPMFLIAEDLRAGAQTGGNGEPALAAALRAMAGDHPHPADAPRLIEVLADRHLLGPAGPVFTRLSDVEKGR